MTQAICKEYFKKCRSDHFALCAVEPQKDWIGIEPERLNHGLYHYIVFGKIKMGIPFKEGYNIVESKKFFSTKEYLHESLILEALEDSYMVGFNTLDKDQDWDGRLVTEEKLRVEKESYLICFDGLPVVEKQELTRFDYGIVYPDKEYEIDVSEGVLGLFTQNI